MFFRAALVCGFAVVFVAAAAPCRAAAPEDNGAETAVKQAKQVPARPPVRAGAAPGAAQPAHGEVDRIHVGDTIQIRVFGQPDLSMEVLVTQSG